MGRALLSQGTLWTIHVHFRSHPWDRIESHVHRSSGRDAGKASAYSGRPHARDEY